jgi:hypothetical protein
MPTTSALAKRPCSAFSAAELYNRFGSVAIERIRQDSPSACRTVGGLRTGYSNQVATPLESPKRSVPKFEMKNLPQSGEKIGLWRGR